MPTAQRETGWRDTVRKRILIVDDSPTVRTGVVNMIGDEFDCDTAEDGQQALTKALGARPDAILADLNMPSMDGIELLKALRADTRTSSIPVVIATTVTEVERVNECRALRPAGFVLKPIEEAYLRAKLRQLTRSAA